MIDVFGTAIIQDSKSGQRFEIDNNEIEFEELDNTYTDGYHTQDVVRNFSAVLYHRELGKLEWTFSGVESMDPDDWIKFNWGKDPWGRFGGRDTDIGLHKLIQDIDIEIGIDPYHHEMRRRVIDNMVEWFNQNYENPANILNFDSKEGGYQWMGNGPYHAKNELILNFSDDHGDIIEEAVKKLESEGITEWAKKEDIGEDSSNNDLGKHINQFSALISELPTSKLAPTFSIGDDGLLHPDSPQNAQPTDSSGTLNDDALYKELVATIGALIDSLRGSNEHIILFKVAEVYKQAFNGDQVSIPQLYAGGVWLQNAASIIQASIDADDLSPLPLDSKLNLETTLEIHGAFIMSQAEGRRLVENAADYRQPQKQTHSLFAAGKHICKSVEDSSGLFGENAREVIIFGIQNIGKGPHPERSNQVALAIITNLVKAVGTVVVTNAVLSSGVGSDAVVSLSGGIDIAWGFLKSISQSLHIVAACLVGADLSSMPSLFYQIYLTIRRLNLD